MTASEHSNHKYAKHGRGDGCGGPAARSPRLRRTLLLTAMVMLCTFIMSHAVLASGSAYTERLSETFEKTIARQSYDNNLDNTSLNFISTESRILVEGNAGSINGLRSIRIYNCDLRWWDLSIEDTEFRIGFSLKVSSGFDNEFRLTISTQDSTTTTESLGGTLLIVRNEADGETWLYGADNTRLTALKKDTVYPVYVDISRGSNQCSVTVGGSKLSRTFKFKSPVYCITGMRMYMPEPVYSVSTPTAESASSETPGNVLSGATGVLQPESTAGPGSGSVFPTNEVGTGEATLTALPAATELPTAAPTEAPHEPSDSATLIVDDIYISTRGRNYPQRYSIQEPGEVPEVKLPDEPDGRVRVYVNTKEIDMSKTYVTDNTVYISLEQFLKGISIDYAYDRNDRLLTISNDKIELSVHVPGDEITLNGAKVKLKYPVRTIDDVIMISPNFINEVFNSRVWWDRDAGMLVVTSGKQKSDGILRLVGSRLYMNGEPFYEISFNKYDLFTQLWAAYSNDPEYPSEEYREPAAEAALRQLSENGFNTIRVFCGAPVPDLMYDAVIKGKYFEAMDRMFELCDKYNIKIVACLSLISDNYVVKQKVEGYGLVNKDENTLDLVADPSCESRALLAQYIKEFVERYGSRQKATILMYEIVNEGNLEADVGATTRTVCYSLEQLAGFYRFCTETIRKYDSERVVTGGDSALRYAQWNLYCGTKAGRAEDDWTPDTARERLYALYMLNVGVDVVSTHTYGLGTEASEAYYYDDGARIYYSFEYLKNEADRLGKPLYVGELSVLTKTDSLNYVRDVRNYLNSVVSADIQLSHWWTFRSDSQSADRDESWRNDSGEVFEALVEANSALKDKYLVNIVAAENTDVTFGNSSEDIFDPDKIVSGATASKETSMMEAVKWALLMLAAAGVSCVAVVAVFRWIIVKGKRKRAN